MAINLGSAYGKVSLDVRGLLDAVRTGKANLQQLAQVGEQVGTALQSAGRKLTIGLTLPIMALGAASISAASDYEETKNKAVVVFAEMADSVVENSNRAATVLGMSREAYLDYASAIGAALTAGGMGIREATELSEGAVKHFADLASFHNARVEDVAAAWQSAIRGQYEPIQRYFPFITNSYLITYGVANGMIDANTKNLTANQRAIILNAIALDEKLNPAVDDFAETSDGLANSTRIMQAQFKDTLIMLGQNLLPIALQVVTALNKMMEAFNNMTPFQQKMVLGFLAFLAILGPVLSGLGWIISTISTLVGLAPMLSGLGISFAGIGSAAAAAGTALAGVAATAATVVLPILLIVGAVALLYWAFKTNFMGISTTAQQLWFIIKHYFREGWEWLKTANDEALADMGAGLVNGFQAMQERFANFIEWVRNTWANMREFLANAFRNINWSQIGHYIVSGLANGILGGIPMLIMAATRAAQEALNAIKKKLRISSDSKEAIELGRFTTSGFLHGMGMGMDPSALERIAQRPVAAMANSTNQSVTMNFANGVTLRQVQQMLETNNEQLLSRLNAAFGGV